MAFSERWHELLEAFEDLPDGASLVPPLTHERVRVADMQEHRFEVDERDIVIVETDASMSTTDIDSVDRTFKNRMEASRAP